MSFNFVIPEMNIGGNGNSPFVFYKRGFVLGNGTTPSWQDIILSGNTALTLSNALANGLNYLKLFGGTEQNGTPSPETPMDIVSNNGALKFGGNILDSLDLGQGTYVSSATNRIWQEFGKLNGKYKITITGNFEFIVQYRNTPRSGSTPTESGNIDTWTAVSGEYVLDNPDYYYGIAIRYPNNADITPSDFNGTLSLEPLFIYTDGTTETVEAHSKNIYTGLISQFTSQGGIGTTYDYFKLPKENTNYTLSCTCKKDYVGSASVFFGFSGNGGDASNAVVWAVSAKMSSNKGDVITVNNNFDGRILNFVSLYMKGQGTLDTLAEYYDIQIEEGSTATAYEPYSYGGSATAEMLLSLGDYKDVQNVLDGVVTRNIGIKVLDGSEQWSYYSVQQGNMFRTQIADSVSNGKDALGVLCNYYETVGTSLRTNNTLSGTSKNYDFINNNYTNLTDWTAHLAQQYANGTPVIIVYPLEEATTESVTAQPLSIQAGTNIVEITQASIDNLGLEVSYKGKVG